MGTHIERRDTAVRLRTERLLLRPWKASDRAPFAQLNADPAVMRYFPALLTREQSDAVIDRIQDDFDREGWSLFALEELDGGAFIGFAGLVRVRFKAHFTPAVEVGWRLARHAWGRGYATEAARAAVRFGFEEVGLDEIVSLAVPANARSIAVMGRLGMTRDPAGDFDHPSVPADSPACRHVLYRLPAPASRGA